MTDLRILFEDEISGTFPAFFSLKKSLERFDFRQF